MARNRQKNSNANKNSNSTGSRQLTESQVIKHNDRKDLMSSKNLSKGSDKMSAKGKDNDPNWYFLDKTAAEETTRFSMNTYVGQTPIDNVKPGSIMSINLNPCPGVSLPGTNPNWDKRPKGLNVINTSGINLAARQWWFDLTSHSGRGATYSKVDIAMLILAEGEIISMVEWIRRAFGIARYYSLRNRNVPMALWRAMRIDGQDFMNYMANYRTMFNVIIAAMNKLPIPGNITYLQKCQSLYEKLYTDSDSDYAQTYLFNPSTTWKLDETYDTEGSVLMTTPWVHDLDSGVVTIGTYSGNNVNHSVEAVAVPDLNDAYGPRSMQYYLFELQDMVEALVSSSTYSVIYSDIINLTGGKGLWSFDSLKEDYVTPIEVAQYNALLQIHNITVMSHPTGVERADFISHRDATPMTSPDWAQYTKRYDCGTPLNDVFCDAVTDSLVYNPSFRYGAGVDAMNGTSNQISLIANNIIPEVIIDGLKRDLTVEDRVEMTRFISSSPEYPNINNFGVSLDKAYFGHSMILPDHWVTSIAVFSSNDFDPDNAFLIAGAEFTPYSVMNQLVAHRATQQTNVALSLYSDFQWAPGFVFTDAVNNDEIYGRLGELNYPTKLPLEWLSRVNSMTYMGLFTFR